VWLYRQWQWRHECSVQTNATQIGNVDQLPTDGGGGAVPSDAGSTISWGANCDRAHSAASKSTAAVSQLVGCSSCQRLSVSGSRYVTVILMTCVNFIPLVCFSVKLLMTLFVSGTWHQVWPSLKEHCLYSGHTQDCLVLLNIDVLLHCLINLSHHLAFDPILFMVVFFFRFVFLYFPFFSYISSGYAWISSLCLPPFHTTVYSMMTFSNMYSLVLNTDIIPHFSAMQEEVLKLVLLALEDGSALSRKVLVMFVVQRLEPHFPQASKTSIGHVVQLLYRASCFKVGHNIWSYLYSWSWNNKWRSHSAKVNINTSESACL